MSVKVQHAVAVTATLLCVAIPLILGPILGWVYPVGKIEPVNSTHFFLGCPPVTAYRAFDYDPYLCPGSKYETTPSGSSQKWSFLAGPVLEDSFGMTVSLTPAPNGKLPYSIAHKSVERQIGEAKNVQGSIVLNEVPLHFSVDYCVVPDGKELNIENCEWKGSFQNDLVGNFACFETESNPDPQCANTPIYTLPNNGEHIHFVNISVAFDADPNTGVPYIFSQIADESVIGLERSVFNLTGFDMSLVMSPLGSTSVRTTLRFVLFDISLVIPPVTVILIFFHSRSVSGNSCTFPPLIKQKSRIWLLFMLSLSPVVFFSPISYLVPHTVPLPPLVSERIISVSMILGEVLAIGSSALLLIDNNSLFKKMGLWINQTSLSQSVVQGSLSDDGPIQALSSEPGEGLGNSNSHPLGQSKIPVGGSGCRVSRPFVRLSDAILIISSKGVITAVVFMLFTFWWSRIMSNPYLESWSTIGSPGLAGATKGRISPGNVYSPSTSVSSYFKPWGDWIRAAEAGVVISLVVLFVSEILSAIVSSRAARKGRVRTEKIFRIWNSSQSKFQDDSSSLSEPGQPLGQGTDIAGHSQKGKSDHQRLIEDQNPNANRFSSKLSKQQWGRSFDSTSALEGPSSSDVDAREDHIPPEYIPHDSILHLPLKPRFCNLFSRWYVLQIINILLLCIFVLIGAATTASHLLVDDGTSTTVCEYIEWFGLLICSAVICVTDVVFWSHSGVFVNLDPCSDGGNEAGQVFEVSATKQCGNAPSQSSHSPGSLSSAEGSATKQHITKTATSRSDNPQSQHE